MDREEELTARELHRNLAAALAPERPPVEMVVDYRAANGKCTASRGEFSCIVYCFYYDMRHRTGPEYQVCFFRRGQMQSCGRTPACADAVGAVRDWVRGVEINDLYEKYAFVDRQKRTLTALRSALLSGSPELRRAASYELRGSWDSYRLSFAVGDRDCELSFYGDDPVPNAVFRWDQTPMFAFPDGEAATLLVALRRWMCDRAMPSAMKAEFPWLRPSEVAAYYEQGRPIEGEFLLSWDGIERWYREIDRPFATDVLRLIGSAGYDHQLRAGQSLWFLVVSRSRRHGLRRDQPSIAFVWKADGMVVEARLDVEQRMTVPTIELTAEVNCLLAGLAAMTID
jgi:hypothetical protein